MKKADYKPSLITIALTFLRLGATTFGGMWAVTKQLEDQLVHKEKWLYPGELESLLVTATLIPAPKFMSLAGIIGYSLHGIVGCIIAGLILTSAIEIMKDMNLQFYEVGMILIIALSIGVKNLPPIWIILGALFIGLIESAFPIL